MKCGYFDCFCGAAGDMILAALLDAGLELETLQDVATRLRLPEVTLSVERVQRGGLAGLHLNVQIQASHAPHHRHLPDILDRIAQANLSAATTERAGRIFQRLAEAEAKAHGISPAQVHFHEVGAADALVDIVGACAGLEALGLERIICSPVPVGSGTVTCAHGVLPVPAPATAELLRGVPLADCDAPGELTTPTGAAILTTLTDSYGPLPAMRVQHVGYGAGTRENRARPNILRLLIGEVPTAAPAESDLVTVLEAQVDDATGQTVAYACERLLAAGALDAFVVPIIMKKGRPGQLVTVLCRPDDSVTLEDVLFRDTTTFGIRRQQCYRTKLTRTEVTVATPFGPIRLQVGRRGDAVVQAWPEYEECAAAARRANVSLRAVQEAALSAWSQQNVRNG